MCAVPLLLLLLMFYRCCTARMLSVLGAIVEWNSPSLPSACHARIICEHSHTQKTDTLRYGNSYTVAATTLNVSAVRQKKKQQTAEQKKENATSVLLTAVGSYNDTRTQACSRTPRRNTFRGCETG